MLFGFGGPGRSSGNAEPLILLSATTIAENAADNSVVGALSVANPEGTYVFTIEVGDDPDNKFAISGDNLIIDELLDYETATSHSVTITANPDVGDTIERTFTITVTDVADSGVLIGDLVLTWDLDDTDSTPEFEVDFPLGNGAPTDIAVDDVLHFRHKLQSGGGYTDYVNITVTAGHISGDPLSFAGATPVANEAYTFEVRAERDSAAITSNWATDDVTVDAVAATTREFAVAGLVPGYLNATGARQYMTPFGVYVVEL
jgi:hypothetical protein